MWLNGFSLNIDGVALCKMLVLNQTEQGLRHLLGCAILLSLCCGACLRLGRSATFDLCPKESEAHHVCFSCFFLLLGVRIFIIKASFLPLTLPDLLPLFYSHTYTDTCAHRHTRVSMHTYTHTDEFII